MKKLVTNFFFWQFVASAHFIFIVGRTFFENGGANQDKVAAILQYGFEFVVWIPQSILGILVWQVFQSLYPTDDKLNLNKVMFWGAFFCIYSFFLFKYLIFPLYFEIRY
jgi:hypothetical protein